MYKRLVGVLYVLNILFQGLFTMLMPAALGFGLGWAAINYLGAPKWILAPLLVIGVLWGFYSMIKFILSAMAGYERLEREQNTGKKNTNNENEK